MTTKDPTLVARHTSTSSEHYTPSYIVEAARKLFGRINLDPASSFVAQKHVQADRWFGAKENGFTRDWSGNVFLNPPGGTCSADGVSLVKHPKPEKGWFLPNGKKAKGYSSQKAWWFKLAREYERGRVRSAIFVCFSIEMLQTVQTGLNSGVTRPGQAHWEPRPGETTPFDFPICFPKKRVDYLSDDGRGNLVPGGAPPHASCIVYLPPVGVASKSPRFVEIFGPIGRILYPVL